MMMPCFCQGLLYEVFREREERMHQGALNIPVSRGPGRPKKGESAHIMGAAEAAALGYEGLQGAIVPRLFNLDAAAAYLSMSPWTIRDLEAKGVPP